MAQFLSPGDPAPWFVAPCAGNPTYNLNTVAGRYVVLCFYGTAEHAALAAMLAAFAERRDLFDDSNVAFFAVSASRDDERLDRVRDRIPGFRVFWDFGLRIARAYGVCEKSATSAPAPYRPVSYVLDPDLRVIATLPIGDPARHVDELCRCVAALPRRGQPNFTVGHAPVLVLPRVFEPEFCRELIALYEQRGGADSGFMRTDPESGKTIGVIDYGHKRRRDYFITEDEVKSAILSRLERRLVPAIRKAFQFRATRIERYVIACYDAGEGGYFRPHRDDTTKGTAHRRFAVTINLNAEEYEGGDLRFPEYDTKTYRAPTGGAVVFSCSVLHEATPVTRGRRYCVLPFLYDEEAAQVRQANLKYVASADPPGGDSGTATPGQSTSGAAARSTAEASEA